MIKKPISQGDSIIYNRGAVSWWWDRYIKDGENLEIVKLQTNKRKGLRKYESKILAITIGPVDKIQNISYFIKKDNGLKINPISFRRMFNCIAIKGINPKVTIL